MENKLKEKILKKCYEKHFKESVIGFNEILHGYVYDAMEDYHQRMLEQSSVTIQNRENVPPETQEALIEAAYLLNLELSAKKYVEKIWGTDGCGENEDFEIQLSNAVSMMVNFCKEQNEKQSLPSREELLDEAEGAWIRNIGQSQSKPVPELMADFALEILKQNK